VGAADDGKATGVTADVGISAPAEPSVLRTIVAASRATTDRKTCRIIEARREWMSPRLYPHSSERRMNGIGTPPDRPMEQGSMEQKLNGFFALQQTNAVGVVRRNQMSRMNGRMPSECGPEGLDRKYLYIQVSVSGGSHGAIHRSAEHRRPDLQRVPARSLA
jgi:hypothetical protein